MIKPSFNNISAYFIGLLTFATLIISSITLTDSNNNSLRVLLEKNDEMKVTSKGKNKVYAEPKHMSLVYGRETMSEEKLSWRNMVFVILTYNDPNANMLIRAQFDTWIQRVGEGADIFVVTDHDDERMYEEIIPSSTQIKANVHLYKSKAPKEGKKARSKVIDAFYHVYETFISDEEKKFFVKIDPDTYVIAERYIEHLSEINQITSPLPVDIGSCLCNTPVCYSIGGLYGYSRKGLELILDYILKHLEIFNEVMGPNCINNCSENSMEHEDFFTSYVFWKATGYPVTCSNEISVRFSKPSLKVQNIASIHPLKSFEDFYALEKIFYDENDHARDTSFQHKHKRYLNYINFLSLLRTH